MTFLTLKAIAIALMANLALSVSPIEAPEEADQERPPETDRGDVYRDPPYAPRPRPDRDYPPELLDILVGPAGTSGLHGG